MKETCRPYLEGIEGLRAFAALLILLYHMVMLPDMAIPTYLIVIKEHFGHGVPLFYALSGFVLAYGYLERLEGRSKIIRFYVRRYFRIAPLFYVMIVVWLVVSKLKWGEFPASYHDIVLNVSLLFGLVPGKHESIVWAGWSIGVEILFYLLFPVVVVVVRNVCSGLLAVVVFIVVSSSCFTAAGNMEFGSYAYMNIVTHLPTFLSGVFAYLIWKKTGFMRNTLLGIVLFILAFVSMLAVMYMPSVYLCLMKLRGVRLDLYIWSLLFMVLILSTCLWANPLFTNRVTTGMGKSSFSIYLWHPLIIVLLVDVYKKIGGLWGTGLLNFLVCSCLTVSIVTMVAYISFRVIERPCMLYGKRVTNAT